MIHDVDESLRELLDASVVRGANIDIEFDLPDKEWAARRQGPTINVYLYDIREDMERRQVQFEPQYDGDGIVTSRRTPPRKFKLEYMVTAWAQRSEDEHRLLSAIMTTFINADEFPREHLRGSAAEVGPVRTTIALPLPQGRSLSDIWSALGSGLRPALDLIVTLPMGGRVDPYVGPPVLEGPKVSVLGPDGRPVAPMRKGAGGDPGRDDAAPAPVVPLPPAAADPRQPAAAGGPGQPGARPPSVRSPGARSPREASEVIDASRFRGGRALAEVDDDDLAPGRRVGMATMPRTPTGS